MPCGRARGTVRLKASNAVRRLALLRSSNVLLSRRTVAQESLFLFLRVYFRNDRRHDRVCTACRMLVASLVLFLLPNPWAHTRSSYPTRGLILASSCAMHYFNASILLVDLDRALGILSKSTSRQREVQPDGRAQNAFS